MPRGGNRIGAGRKRGSKTARTSAIALNAAEAGVTPVEYMLSIMRDDTQPQTIRLQAACMAAPYVHPRLAHIHQTRSNPGALNKLYDAMQAELVKGNGQAITMEATPMITDAMVMQNERIG